MAETAILNPVRGITPGTSDNYNPDYGYTRKTAANNQLAKSRLGSWYQRDTLNAGYSFEMQWVARSWTTMLHIKQFYESYKGGYFTYIDWDGNCRHHVGRFTTAPNPVQVANGKYNLQGMVFEDVPQARMVRYPADFSLWSRNINAVDDSLLPTAGTYAGPGTGAWLPIVDPMIAATASAIDPSAYVTYIAAPSAGDFAQVQYVGWGFQLQFRTSPNMGLCDVYVDGALFQQNVDLSGPGPVLTVANTHLSLDMHRVKVVARALPGAFAASSSGASPSIAVQLPAIKVIV